jgi:hypothetical protein
VKRDFENDQNMVKIVGREKYVYKTEKEKSEKYCK